MAETLPFVPPTPEALVDVGAPPDQSPMLAPFLSSSSIIAASGASERSAGQAPRAKSISRRYLLRCSIAFSASSRTAPIVPSFERLSTSPLLSAPCCSSIPCCGTFQEKRGEDMLLDDEDLGSPSRTDSDKAGEEWNDTWGITLLLDDGSMDAALLHCAAGDDSDFASKSTAEGLALKLSSEFGKPRGRSHFCFNSASNLRKASSLLLLSWSCRRGSMSHLPTYDSSEPLRL